MVVAVRQDRVADGVEAVAGRPLLDPQASRGTHPQPGPPIQIVDLVAVEGEHHRAARSSATDDHQLGDQSLAEGVGVVVMVQSVVGDVGGQRVIGIAGAQVPERLALPSLDLAPVDGERRPTLPPGEGNERGAGLDLGELAGIADQDDFGVRP